MHLFNPAGALAALVLFVGGCASAPDTEPITISPEAEAHLQRYLDRVGSVGGGAFAVSPDGRYAFYSYCTDTLCGGQSLSQDALQGCRHLAGVDCVLLAHSRNLLRPHRVAGAAPSAAEG